MIGSYFKYLALILILLIQPIAGAQNISVNLEPESGTTSDSFMLSITVHNARIGKSSAPQLNDSKEFIINSSGTSSETQITNGSISNQISFNYELSPRDGLPAGEYTTPSGTLNINGNQLQIPSKKITITETPPDQRQKTDTIKINQFTDKEIAYVGEQITYTVQVISGDDFLGGNLQDIEVLGFWREKLGDQEKKVFQAGAKTITTFQEVLIPNRSGKITIPGRRLSAQMQGPARRIGGGLSGVFDNNPFFKGFLRSSPMLAHTQVMREFSTQPVKIEIKPLPSTEIKGYIPVGQLNLKSSFDKEQIKKGDSINLNLRLSGFANLRPLEIQKPEGIEDSFKVYIDPAETNVSYEKARVRFTKTFNIALVPTHSGELTIPEFKINYFDPLAEQYKTLSTESKKIQVEGNFDDRLLIEEEKQPEQEETTPETDLLLDKQSNLNVIKSANLSFALILLSFFASLAIYLKRNRNKVNKTESAINIAYRELEDRIDYSTVVKNYLGKKLNKNFLPNTLNEIQVDYIEKLDNEQISSRAKVIFSQLENFLYNPNQKVPDNFKNDLIEFIKLLDNNL